MITLKVILFAIALVSLAILALAIRIVLVKDGKFPETHISRSSAMKKKGIRCAQTIDRMEQVKNELQNRYTNVKVIK